MTRPPRWIVMLLVLSHSLDHTACCQNTRSPAQKAIEHLRAKGADFTLEGDIVTGINFVRATLENDDISYLADINSLRSISLEGHQIPDDSLQHLAKLNQLKSLDVSSCSIGNPGLVVICNNRNITSLKLAGTRVTDLHALAPMVQLHKLDLSHCAIGDDQLSQLSGLVSLTDLSLNSTEISDRGLRELAKLQHLETLNLADTRTTDRSVDLICGFRNLKKLQLAYAMGNTFEAESSLISQRGLLQISRANDLVTIFGTQAIPPKATLRIVNSHGTTTADRDFQDLLTMEHKSTVESIDAAQSIADDDFVKSLTSFTELKTLILRRTWITDEALKHISSFRNLESLDIADTRVSDSGIKYLSGCPRLKTLVIANTPTSGIAFRSMKELTFLTTVDISRNDNFARWQPRLRLSSGISDDGLESIAQLTSIRHLNISYWHGPPNVSGNGIQHLLRLVGLRELEAHGWPISEDMRKRMKQELPNAKIAVD